MPCYVSKGKDGHPFFFCGRNLKEKKCADCLDLASKLCDYPVGKGKTCDRPVCDLHSAAVGPNLDYCATHFEMWKRHAKATGVEPFILESAKE